MSFRKLLGEVNYRNHEKIGTYHQRMTSTIVNMQPGPSEENSSVGQRIAQQSRRF